MIIEVVVFLFQEFKEKYIIATIYDRTREYDSWQGCIPSEDATILQVWK